MYDCLNTYHNNVCYGTSPHRPVKFTEIKRVKHNGEWVDVLTANREFFERIRNGCEPCHVFWADICPCIEFGDTRKVFLSDKTSCGTRKYEKEFLLGKKHECCEDGCFVEGFEEDLIHENCGCEFEEEFIDVGCGNIVKCHNKLMPLETRHGFVVRADQIQPYAGSHRLIKMMACYDVNNLHVDILSPIMPHHRKCNCNELEIYRELGYK